METSTCVHAYCNKGLFHSAEPLHTHTRCNNCLRMRRREGLGSTGMKLFRCNRCSTTNYCSRDCQKAHWGAGHKKMCDVYAVAQKLAAVHSGNPSAWSDLVTFANYHHATLVNFSAACYLKTKSDLPDITSRYFVQIFFLYQNDPALPPHKRFKPCSMDLLLENNQNYPDIYQDVYLQVPAAAAIGRREFGRDYWGVGAYILMVTFREGGSASGGAIPFWKHFCMDKRRGKAKPACKDPWEMFEEAVTKGRKARVCCSHVTGAPTCCCGGSTHQPQN